MPTVTAYRSWLPIPPLCSQNLGQSHYFRAELGSLLAKPTYTMEIKLTGMGVSFKDLYTDQFHLCFYNNYTFCEVCHLYQYFSLCLY